MSAALYFSLQEDHPRHFGRGPLPSSVEDEDDWEINVELSDDDGESPLVTVKQTAQELPDVDDSKPEPKKALEEESEEPKKDVKDGHQTDHQKEPNIEIEVVEVSPFIKSIQLIGDPVDSFQEPLKESETAKPKEEPEKEELEKEELEELEEPQKEKEELEEPQKEQKKEEPKELKEEVSPFITKKPKKTKGGSAKESMKENCKDGPKKEEPTKDDLKKEDHAKKDYTKLISDEMNNLCLT